MAYIRKKRTRRTTPAPARNTNVEEDHYVYYQVVEGFRDDGKVRQRVLAHLGPHPTPQAALEAWQREYERWLQMYAQREAMQVTLRIRGEADQSTVATTHKRKGAEARRRAYSYQEKLKHLREVVEKYPDLL